MDELAELGWSRFLTAASRAGDVGGRPAPPVPGRTSTSFGFSTLERAIQESLGRRLFGQAEVAKVIEFFDQVTPTCVYCGSEQVSRWDHLVPVIKGGETVLGNMVPACAPCDDSKQALPFDSWLPGRLRKLGASDEALLHGRIARLFAYAKAFGYTPTQVETRLTPEELSRVVALRERARHLRQDMDELFADFANSRGEKATRD